jgi:hypothetical protein
MKTIYYIFMSLTAVYATRAAEGSACAKLDSQVPEVPSLGAISPRSLAALSAVDQISPRDLSPRTKAIIKAHSYTAYKKAPEPGQALPNFRISPSKTDTNIAALAAEGESSVPKRRDSSEDALDQLLNSKELPQASPKVRTAALKALHEKFPGMHKLIAGPSAADEQSSADGVRAQG